MILSSPENESSESQNNTKYCLQSLIYLFTCKERGLDPAVVECGKENESTTPFISRNTAGWGMNLLWISGIVSDSSLLTTLRKVS